MTTLTREQIKRLRNDFECWQQDYDPTADREQYKMFGDGMAAMDMLLASMQQESVLSVIFKDGWPEPGSTGLTTATPKFADGVYEFYAAPPAPVVPDGWISCSERMPKKGQEVLCMDQFDNYEAALYDTGYIPGPPFFATTAGEFHPTHWMPLPAAPQQ
ncbi:DUF551 domain-containing protein [Yokenella regensburgei]|uniref:DUF551 domain-containing protein n=1 Tax=Yokenella regensburgei TaxID=158877 RepID=UPI001432B68F|nr:DUF551 domain-containing protein [Yokenella regensburgei]QIU92108.1 DUF551 domain-containing protein [Yokenella regensburgei]